MKTGRPRTSLAERFWSKVDKNGPKQPHMRTQCWIWVGGLQRDANGVYWHGVIGAGGRGARMLYAHRVSFEIHRGSIPSRLWVLHRCDVASCVRPSHLFLGTHADNMSDAAKKNRMASGERNGSSKLNSVDVIQIRSKHTIGWSYQQLAKHFGVSKSQVGNIIRLKSWRL